MLESLTYSDLVLPIACAHRPVCANPRQTVVLLYRLGNNEKKRSESVCFHPDYFVFADG